MCPQGHSQVRSQATHAIEIASYTLQSPQSGLVLGKG
jgi:hypothetical protein